MISLRTLLAFDGTWLSLSFYVLQTARFFQPTLMPTSCSEHERMNHDMIRRRLCSQLSQVRSLAVYAVGHGWTGALGNTREVYPGHDDEEDIVQAPLCLWKGSIDDISLGWGHTALISENQLYVTGRPYDFSTLLRLHRLPGFLRGHHDYSWIGWIAAQFGADNTEHSTLFPEFTPFSIPDKPVQVKCSAGLTAVITESKNLYTMGIHRPFGQCGVDSSDAHVIWEPTLVLENIEQFAWGLQHAIALDSAGQVFVWGKGDAGQLGQTAMTPHSAKPLAVTQGLLEIKDPPEFVPLGKIVQVDSGMIHCAVLDEDGCVWWWGKHGARIPTKLSLPSRVAEISCGSHHTVMLLADGSVWAMGLATDTKAFLAPHELFTGKVDSLSAHSDRTTIIENGRATQIHLWEDEELQNYSAFTPPWLEGLPPLESVRRSWKHSVAVTKE